MRKINKGKPIQVFSDFISESHPTQWDQLDHTVRINTREHILIEEQDCICGYTELPLDIDNNSCHIDHYKKRSLFPNLCFDWNNLIVASKDDDFGARYKDHNYVAEKNQYNHLLNPVNDDANDFFEYTTWGEIVIKNTGLSNVEKIKAEETIKAFNLNHRSLTKRRETTIKILCSFNGQFTLPETLSYLNTMGFTSLIEYFY